jgi:hypothetical protein
MNEAAPSDYADLLTGIKTRVHSARIRAGLAANRELILLYWVIDRLSADIRREFPDIKGFSARNIWRMKTFYLVYNEGVIKLPQAAAEIGSLNEKELPDVFRIPWYHNVHLLEKVKDPVAREWYMRKTIEQGWSRNVLALHIDQQDYERKGQALSNYHTTLPEPPSDLAQDLLKDPYVFDFLGIADDAREREVENALRGLEKPVGVSSYQLTRALPDDLKPSLPTIEEIESELAEKVDADAPGETAMILREWEKQYRIRKG